MDSTPPAAPPAPPLPAPAEMSPADCAQQLKQQRNLAVDVGSYAVELAQELGEAVIEVEDLRSQAKEHVARANAAKARNDAAARSWWQAVGAANLIQCRSESSVAWSAPGQRARTLPPEQVAARLAGSGQ